MTTRGERAAEAPLSICQRCNRDAPLRRVRYLQVVGVGLAWILRRQGGEYCRRCSNGAFARASLFSLLFGWWSITAVFMTPVVVGLNVVRWLSTLGPESFTRKPVARVQEEGRVDLGPRPGDTVPRAASELEFSELPPARRGSTLGAEWWLAMGHLRSKKSEDFISLTTSLSIVGVVAGVAILNWVLAVMTGFELDLRDKILGANAHVVVLRYGGNIPEAAGVPERVEALEGVTAAAPFTYSEMMIRSSLGTSGVILKGMDPERTGEVTSLQEDLVLGMDGEVTTPEQRAGVFASMSEELPPLVTAPESDQPAGRDLPGLLVGNELQEQLQVQPGDEVQIINPLGVSTGIMGIPTPKVRAFRVAGVFSSGMYEYDTKWVYVDNDVAQSFLEIGDTWTGVELRVEDIDDVEQISRDIEAELGFPYYTRHWKSMNRALFEALELEKVVMGLILSSIVMVAGLAIVATLVMLVLTKRREIAILKAMGASSASIMRVFVIQGTLIGLVGSLLGTVLGLVGCQVLDWYQFPLETDVYYLSSLPVVVEPATVVVVAIAAFVISFLVTLYPAWQAASLDPVEGLRYE